jgi:hypothetical protein
LLRKLFATQVPLHEKIQKLAKLGQLDHDDAFREQCLHGFRKSFRALRFLEDDLGEASVGFPYDHRMQTIHYNSGRTSQVEKVVPAFDGGPGYLLWNPAFGQDGKKYIPRSGDLILSRGDATTSAAIARVSDEEAQFSHLTVVYVDSKTKKIETIEAHIEIGSEVFPWEDYIGDKKVRAVVFRLKNSKLAHKAAKEIRNLVLNYKKSHHGKRICYDFGMDMNDHSCIFCAEIARVAYEKAGLTPAIPLFPSSLKKNRGSFLDAIGVTATTTFAPGDIELDPRFDLVAEWRDYGRVHTAQEMDAVLTAMYSWMREKNYMFFPNAKYKGEADLGYILRRLPLFDLLVNKKFPLNMTRKTIATVQTLNDVVNSMTDYLQDQEQKLKTRPQRLSYVEMLTDLEALRARDEYEELQAKKHLFYKRTIKSAFRFHKLFHPADWNR